MKKDYHLTRSGVGKLKDELEHLKSHRKEIAEKLKIARDYGDLSENAEYHDAREQQVQLESRVKEIEHILKNVQIIDEPKLEGVVELGNTIKLSGNGENKELTIVGSVEADPESNKISDESPFGKALLGKKKGDKVTVSLPAGDKTYTIKQVD